jgi:hypothetical protein
MAVGALKQARDLLTQVEVAWDWRGCRILELSEILTQQRARCREAEILLNTVLEE